MKTPIHLALICLSLLTPTLFGQNNTMATPPPVPEEARKHFVMGTALFKDAKTPDDYAQVVGEFKQAADLAPQWPDARYNLALAKEAAGDYSGGMADLKLYQQFKLSDDEARTVQDKIYVLEAKQEKAVKEQADKKDSFIKLNDQKITDLQKRFPELINKIDGATFTGHAWDTDVEIKFTDTKVNNWLDGQQFNSGPFVCALYKSTGENQFGHPGVVIPTSDDTFYVTSETSPTSLNFDYTRFNHDGGITLRANKWNLLQNAQDMTITEDYDANGSENIEKHQLHVYYLTKKQ